MRSELQHASAHHGAPPLPHRCEPFSPVSTGEIILKCRALNDATGASGGSARQDGSAPLYLRLNVSMVGPRRLLVLIASDCV